jgi:hypothetical protein
VIEGEEERHRCYGHVQVGLLKDKNSRKKILGELNFNEMFIL